MENISESIYANVENTKSPNSSSTGTTQKGSESKENIFHGRAIFVYLGLLCVLLAGIIGLGVYNLKMTGVFDEMLSMYQANLTEFQTKNFNLTEEIKRLQKPTCPEGWKMFQGCRSCYFVSIEAKPWAESRQDCQSRGADLIVIDSLEKQKFLSEITEGQVLFWIGLSDNDIEGDWRWVDDTPLTTTYWRESQPDNWKEEDCAHITTRTTSRNWNDISCNNDLKWICEKKG